MRRVFVFFILSLILGHGAFAECVSVDRVTKCARLPDSLNFRLGSISDSWLDNDNGLDWSAVYENSIVVSGTTVGDLSDDITCIIASPFKAETTVSFEPSFMFADMPAEICSNKKYITSYVYDSIRKLDGDMCPDGFYTVPYEIDCGEGFVDVAGVPECENDVSGDFCLMPPSAAPCAAGITMLRTGTGVSIPLLAERGTEPSLCVKYNDMVCYANLEVGQATGAINVRYNDLVYHTVD